MKRIIKISLLSSLILLAACGEDFLDRPPLDAIVVDNFYQSTEQLRLATAGMYNTPWFDYNDKVSFSVGDGAAGNFLSNDPGMRQFSVFSANNSDARIGEAWRSMYIVIGQANNIIHSINTRASESIPEADKNAALAEARFMRGYAYHYLGMLFGEVPIIENNIELVGNPIIPKNTVEDVFQFAINDMEYAAEYLPEVDPQNGRVTRWSAKGMLARLYLYRSGLTGNGSRNQSDLDMAKTYAEDVIQNSGLTLMSDYADLFKLENNNNQESLFALQWVDNQSGWGQQNTHQAYFAPEAIVTGVGDGWGGANGATPNMQSLYVEGDERRKPTFMYKGDFYPELVTKDGGYLYDLESYAGSAIKKYVIGRPEDNDGAVAFMSTGINTYMLRLAEVYLIAAEAILGNNASTSDSDALQYINTVRSRAGLPGLSSFTYEELVNEKRLEFAMEGRSWFDIIAWSYFAPDDAIAYIENQNRGNFEWETPEGEDENVKIVEDLFVGITAEDFNLPYPEAEIANNPLLLQEAVAFDFSEN